MRNEIEPRIPERQVTQWGIAPCKNGNRAQSGRAMRKAKKWRTSAIPKHILPIPVIKL